MILKKFYSYNQFKRTKHNIISILSSDICLKQILVKHWNKRIFNCPIHLKILKFTNNNFKRFMNENNFKSYKQQYSLFFIKIKIK